MVFTCTCAAGFSGLQCATVDATRPSDPEDDQTFRPIVGSDELPTPDVVSGDGQQYAHIRFSGRDWYLVRRVPPGQHWHPANDELAGTEVYGTASTDPLGTDPAWSLPFGQLRWGEMMVASGDLVNNP